MPQDKTKTSIGCFNYEERSGRYIAYYDHVTHAWDIRIIDAHGKFAMPAFGPIYKSSYTECIKYIKAMERHDDKGSKEDKACIN